MPDRRPDRRVRPARREPRRRRRAGQGRARGAGQARGQARGRAGQARRARAPAGRARTRSRPRPATNHLPRRPAPPRQVPKDRSIAAGSPPRRSRAGWPASTTSTSAEIQGSGPHGRIVKSDVEQAIAKGPTARPVARGPVGPAEHAPAVSLAAGTPAAEVDEFGRPYISRPDRTVKLSQMRKTIAKRMGQAKREIRIST